MINSKQMVSIPRELLEVRISHLEWLGSSALAEAANLRALMAQSIDGRRDSQAQGIEKAKAAGKYHGRPVDEDLHKRVKELLGAGLGIRATARHAQCSNTTALRIRNGISDRPVAAPSCNAESEAEQESQSSGSVDFKKYTATTIQAADALGVSERTLRNIAKQPGFPAALRINQRVIRYDLEAVQAFYFRTLKKEREGASQANTSANSRQPFQWTDEQLAMIGKMPDAALGAKIGMSHSTVYSKRIKLGIKPFLETKVDNAWSPSQISMLGTMSDKAVAEKLGKTREAITSIRLRLGISAKYKKRTKQIETAGHSEKKG